MTKTLRLSPDLSLTLEAATETHGILAKKGAGKTNAARVLVEELDAASVPFVVIDPKGDWWGIRAATDQHEGMAVPVFGGSHGDVPLGEHDGNRLADLILGDGDRGYLSCVVDVSHFTITAQRRFLKEFGERLFRGKHEEGVIHLVLEEAHEYLPQGVTTATRDVVSVWQRIVKQGRFKGLGVTLISQRSAALNKDVLTQVDSLFCLRVLSPQDRKVVMEWLEVHSDARDVVKTLPTLKTGECWLWAPEHFDDPVRFQFRKSVTFDSGATPKVGGKALPPARMADVDLAAIKEEFDEVIERAKADDPRELRKRLAAMEKELATARKVQPAPEPVIERVEVDIISDAVLAKLDAIADRTQQAMAELRDGLIEVASLASIAHPARGREVAVARETPRPREQRAAVSARPTVSDTSRPVHDGDATIGKGERKVLAVLAQYPDGRTYNELAFLAGYSAKASTLGVILSKLRKLDLVEPGNQPVRATDAGLAAAGGVQPLPSGQELLDHWLRHPRMGEGERKVLLALCDQYPNDISHDELCDLTGYSSIASTMGVILSKLRKLGLVEKGARRLAQEFAESIA